MNTTTPHSEKQQSKQMKIIFFAVIIYAVYLLMRLAFRSLANKEPKDKSNHSVITQARRKFDPREAEDADFEEIKKD